MLYILYLLIICMCIYIWLLGLLTKAGCSLKVVIAFMYLYIYILYIYIYNSIHIYKYIPNTCALQWSNVKMEHPASIAYFPLNSQPVTFDHLPVAAQVHMRTGIPPSQLDVPPLTGAPSWTAMQSENGPCISVYTIRLSVYVYIIYNKYTINIFCIVCAYTA